MQPTVRKARRGRYVTFAAQGERPIVEALGV